jgi:hypothetical protein
MCRINLDLLTPSGKFSLRTVWFVVWLTVGSSKQAVEILMLLGSESFTPGFWPFYQSRLV